ncbi:hypothetical protein ACK389_19935 [Streptomyces antibioticus]|uniref:hypothetical protein n=1 Tax=Streptomyces antibioticus TaxID=1890 RepID=UPI0033C45242
MKVKVNRLRSVAVVLAGVALTAALTGCQGGDDDSGKGSGSGGGGGSVGSSATPSGGGGKAPGASPSVSASTPGGSKASPSSPASAAPAADATPSAAPCADGPPTVEEVDPDEIALFRIEEIDGITDKVNLVLQHGAWGCPGKDTDGPPFVVTGEDSRWAMDQGAYVTAVTPIVESTENQRIGVQELIDWVDAHPDSGLVFRYTVGEDGAIHRLEQVFTP